MNLSDPIVAALIAAGATVLATFVQLRISWRKEMRERERGQPITKKTRRGPVTVVLLMMIAAAVGGFALSQYFVSLLEEDRAGLRADLQSKLSEINATAMRLENARLAEREQVEAGVRRADAARLGEEGVAAVAVIGPCPAAPADKQECTEKSAVRVAVCAKVPVSASVKEVLLYTRLEDSQAPWADARVQAGQDAGQARFMDRTLERPDGDGAKQVCQTFVNWSRDKSRLARILVKYAP